ncbi:hypothetical protein [Kitasatospora griseola]|uniref:hypothetical protein n=1 Tax=Kitasatospora griseola TaxID=2064 RepID=UPI00343EA5FC
MPVAAFGELLDQTVVASAAEERVDAVPRREVGRHRPSVRAIADVALHRATDSHPSTAVRLMRTKVTNWNRTGGELGAGADDKPTRRA